MLYSVYTVHCADARAVRTCAAQQPTHPVIINLCHFKGSVAYRLPLLHPETPLELSCNPTVPLRLFEVDATTVCVGRNLTRKRCKCGTLLLQPLTMPKNKGLSHPDPYSQAIRYPSRGSAHLMGPQAFSMASGDGHHLDSCHI